MQLEHIGDATLYIGDNRETLKAIPEASVQTVVTSPPYYGLRDYGHDGQIGLEETPEQYVNTLVDVFREVRRVLRDDGTVWLNLGDSYANGGMSNPSTKSKLGGGKDSGASEYSISRHIPDGLKPKDLIGIPWRVAFALQKDGWYLRQDIIWAKPNPMPESVTDRCTKAHEYIFLLSKSARYFYDAEAVKEPFADDRQGNPNGGGNYARENPIWAKPHQQQGLKRGIWNEDGAHTGRNRRSVWTVATQPYSGTHFATFPPNLIEPCILAGSSHGACEICGAPWERVTEVERQDTRPDKSSKYGGLDEDIRGSGAGNVAFGLARRTEATVKTTGYRPTCTCDNHGTAKSIVLDPFGGSGTTAAVALEHGRKATLCELNPDYGQLVKDRINSITDSLRQTRLFETV